MKSIEYVCFMNSSGYSAAARDIILSLHGSGKYQIKITPLHGQIDKDVDRDNYDLFLRMSRRKFSPSDGAVQVFHAIPDMQYRVPKKEKTIGFATFETSEPPEKWVKILNENSAVIVPSRFNEKVFREAGVTKPVFYVPHTVDTKTFNTSVVKSRSSVFTFMFFGTWKRRKGWRQLVEAWCQEFSPSDGVRLIVKTDKPDVAKREIESHRKNTGLFTKDIAPIVFETRVFDEVELARFMRQADCLLAPTMGEGFGLPALQCMAIGVPVVVTNYSGCRDYANERTATLLEPAGYVRLNSMDNIHQFLGRKWAHVTVESIRRAMRDVLSNVDIVKKKADYAAKFVAENFNRSVTVEAFDHIMDHLG